MRHTAESTADAVRIDGNNDSMKKAENVDGLRAESRRGEGREQRKKGNASHLSICWQTRNPAHKHRSSGIECGTGTAAQQCVGHHFNLDKNAGNKAQAQGA